MENVRKIIINYMSVLLCFISMSRNGLSKWIIGILNVIFNWTMLCNNFLEYLLIARIYAMIYDIWLSHVLYWRNVLITTQQTKETAREISFSAFLAILIHSACCNSTTQFEWPWI